MITSHERGVILVARIQSLVAAVFASLAFIGTAWAQSGGEPVFIRPRFIDSPYFLTVDISQPAGRTFSFTGYAVDDYLPAIVSIEGSGFRSFTRFESTSGNPASFTLRGVDIPSRGTFTINLSASANSDIGLSQGTTLTITIIPEPFFGLAAGIFLGRILYRRRPRTV